MSKDQDFIAQLFTFYHLRNFKFLVICDSSFQLFLLSFKEVTEYWISELMYGNNAAYTAHCISQCKISGDHKKKYSFQHNLIPIPRG